MSSNEHKCAQMSNIWALMSNESSLMSSNKHNWAL